MPWRLTATSLLGQFPKKGFIQLDLQTNFIKLVNGEHGEISIFPRKEGMNAKQKFTAATGSEQFLEANQDAALEKYLKARGWMPQKDKVIHTEKPGEGNMNFVLRVRTEQGSFIVKQSRPWVEKYPQLDAPIGRIHTEAQFYSLVQGNETLGKYTPKLLATDPENYLIKVEDLGHGADFSYVYQKGQDFRPEELESLLTFLQNLHHGDFAQAADSYPKNQALKELNHEHIFRFPYRADNGMDLNAIQEGLHDLATPIYADQNLVDAIAKLGERYLGEGQYLIHGDYYPGSWLTVNGEVKVIDPEFSYFGLAEFDLSVFLAHMKMAQSEASSIKWVKDNYQRPANFDERLLDQFTGIEILRRLIGIAQLPLALSINEKRALIEEAISLIND